MNLQSEDTVTGLTYPVDGGWSVKGNFSLSWFWTSWPLPVTEAGMAA